MESLMVLAAQMILCFLIISFAYLMVQSEKGSTAEESNPWVGKKKIVSAVFMGPVSEEIILQRVAEVATCDEIYESFFYIQTPFIVENHLSRVHIIHPESHQMNPKGLLSLISSFWNKKPHYLLLLEPEMSVNKHTIHAALKGIEKGFGFFQFNKLNQFWQYDPMIVDGTIAQTGKQLFNKTFDEHKPWKPLMPLIIGHELFPLMPGNPFSERNKALNAIDHVGTDPNASFSEKRQVQGTAHFKSGQFKETFHIGLQSYLLQLCFSVFFKSISSSIKAQFSGQVTSILAIAMVVCFGILGWVDLHFVGKPELFFWSAQIGSSFFCLLLIAEVRKNRKSVRLPEQYPFRNQIN